MHLPVYSSVVIQTYLISIKFYVLDVFLAGTGTFVETLFLFWLNMVWVWWQHIKYLLILLILFHLIKFISVLYGIYSASCK